jgi:GntR family transcriptional regulator
LTVFLSIDENDSRPIYLQIVSQVKRQVAQGTLKPGDELPSVRELAQELGINLHTVRGAYLKLRDQGIINLRLGRRATIARFPEVMSADDRKDFQMRMDDLVGEGRLSGLSAAEIQQITENAIKKSKNKV